MQREPENSRPMDEAAVRDAVDSLRGKSQPELFDALRSATQQARAAGDLDNTRMDDIYEKLAPMLTEAQRRKMREVIARLKA